MQFLICEGCDLREKPCIAVDQLNRDETPNTCLYDQNKVVFGNKKWNKVDAADIALWMFWQGVEVIMKKGMEKVETPKEPAQDTEES